MKIFKGTALLNNFLIFRINCMLSGIKFVNKNASGYFSPLILKYFVLIKMNLSGQKKYNGTKVSSTSDFLIFGENFQ